MYLKRLEMQGFKSFVDKTTLDFSGGITSVVGPNGSGKSNIADAIRWVLGEQSAKTLRGGKMEDVIFIGTENRRPVSFSEVSLTIDNSDNILPVDYEEVTVTRRLYRSGESEYLINKSPCRLKDIQQLFLDTGIGVDGYSIIGQGKVDEILSGKQEDRRAIFEEASGIMKYKLRKIEAERKLALTRQNIDRLNDIIIELESQIGPLSEQSEAAKKYLEYKYELREHEVSLYVDSIGRIHNQLQEIDSKFDEVKKDIEEQNALLEQVKKENTLKNERFKALDEKLGSSRTEYYEVEKQLSEFYSDIRLNEEKISSLELKNSKISEEINTYTIKQQEYNKNLEEIKADIEVKQNELDAQKELLKQLEDKYNFVLNLMSSTAKKVQELRDRQTAVNNRFNEKRMYLDRITNQVSLYRKRQNEISDELIHLSKELEASDESISKSEEIEKIFTEQISKLNEDILQIDKVKAEDEIKLEKLRSRENEIRNEFHQKSSRLKILKEMDARFEGYNKSVKEILNLISKGTDLAKGIRGAVAQLVRVDRKYEIAVETALGQAAQNIVTETEEDAKAVIDYLKKYDMGRATFLPMTSVTGTTFDNETIKTLKGMKGYIGLAHELIKYDTVYNNIMLSLLGKVVVADTLENAIEISKRQKYSYKIITLDGDVIRTTGAITGGSINKSATTGVLGRSKVIEDLEQATAALDNSLSKILEEASLVAANVRKLVSDKEKNDTDRRQLELRLVEARSNTSRLKDKKSEIISRTGLLTREMAEIKNEIIKNEEEAAEVEIEMNKIEVEAAELLSQISELESENHAGRSTVDAMNADLTEKKLAANSLKHTIQSLEENYNRITETIENIAQDLVRKRAEIDENSAQIDELKQNNKILNTNIRHHTEMQTGHNIEIERILEEKNIISDELSLMMDKITDITQQIYKLQEEYNRLEVRKSKLDAEKEAYMNRLWDEYELTWNSACEIIKDKEVGSITFRQKKINELKNLIKELGPINVNAIEDYKTTKERYEFLLTQRDDMEQAGEKLEKIKNDMTSIMKKQFMEQFELINKSFSETFKELFDGGKANIVLTDENDVLASPIDIEVQPPGKKLQNMMLLSGGERAMTAIVLLFSIMKLKPSPFCILDEIEATLDDANVYRFADYVKNFVHKSQFIIITHRKGTMEVSDTLYGVTMEEKGISKVVSMKF